MDRLDIYEKLPSGMERYLSAYGWHFSKAACEFAVSMMRDKCGSKVEMCKKEDLMEMAKNFKCEIEAKGYDAVYVAAMVQADFWGGSICSDERKCRYMADVFSDKDGYDGMVFTRWYADMVAKGEPIIWEDLM